MSGLYINQKSTYQLFKRAIARTKRWPLLVARTTERKNHMLKKSSDFNAQKMFKISINHYAYNRDLCTT